MEKFIPNTPTVNPDKEYFVDAGKFLKIDTNVSRGIVEASFLSDLQNSRELLLFPTIHKTWINNSGFNILMDRIQGETLENCKSKLTSEDKVFIHFDLFRMFSVLQSKNIVHGDINESNLIYNQKKKTLHLIDFEFATKEISQRDLTGPNWGIIHVLKWLNQP